MDKMVDFWRIVPHILNCIQIKTSVNRMLIFLAEWTWPKGQVPHTTNNLYFHLVVIETKNFRCQSHQSWAQKFYCLDQSTGLTSFYQKKKSNTAPYG